MRKSGEEVTVPVPVELRDRFGWLKDGVQTISAAAIEKERAARLWPLASSVKAIARSFSSRMRSMRMSQWKADKEKAALTRMWAQHGKTYVEGVTIKPSVSLSLKESELIACLSPHVREAVVEMRPCIKLETLFTLARSDPELQKLVLAHITAAATLSVTAPKE